MKETFSPHPPLRFVLGGGLLQTGQLQGHSQALFSEVGAMKYPAYLSLLWRLWSVGMFFYFKKKEKKACLLHFTLLLFCFLICLGKSEGLSRVPSAAGTFWSTVTLPLAPLHIQPPSPFWSWPLIPVCHCIYVAPPEHRNWGSWRWDGA